MADPERLYDRKEACERLHISLSMLDKLIRAKKLPVLRVGRKVLLRESVLERFLQEREEGT